MTLYNDPDMIRQRITQFRESKGVSEYQMSYSLGHSRGYINNISSGKSLPSMIEFLAICDYFGITPGEFFNEEYKNPVLISNVMDEVRDLEDEDILLLLTLIKRIKRGDK